MDLKHGVERVHRLIDMISNICLRLLWHFLHLLVSLWYLNVGIVQMIESYLVSSGLLKRYNALDVGKIQYLAIVVDSEDTYKFSKVLQLLKWLEAIGVRHLCLYDSKGVLKTFKKTIVKSLKNAMLFEEAVEKDLPLDEKKMTLEFTSSSDGKGAITEAANLLFMKYLKSAKAGVEQEEQLFTEAQMDEALKALGHRGPEPDLLLVYGPVRCYLGFSPWRIRYTEIVHMGPLQSMRYGSLIKALYKFTTVCQNYG
ncbi:dehydrodolichyl diphosphate synthase complex subunit NUS1 isoform X2 [Manihot esculenta]|nr:dehydrodolichyl diphosphate synthase complex subunit NUS1 isoform X2 [Manihot esculenta]